MLKKAVDGVDITEEAASNLSSSEKAQLIQNDAVACARYFDHRFRALKKTWKHKEGPFGNYPMKDYYFRISTQRFASRSYC